jgi:hypothetical protein
MQARFKDKNVTIIGISDEALADVKPFVKRMGDTMDYVVAVDKDRATINAYMGAFGVGTIPHAFVVDSKGKVAWHGNPMSGLERIVEQILAGTFDLAAAKRAANAEKLLPEYFGIVATGKTTPEADKMGQQIVDDAGDNADLLGKFAWIILTHPRVEYRDLALATLAAKKAYDGTDHEDASIGDTYARALFETGEIDQAIRVQKHALKVCTDDDLKAGLLQPPQRYYNALKN